MTENKITIPLFIFDSSVLVSILEEKKDGKKILDRLSLAKTQNMPMASFTLMSSFIRAIYLADHEIKLRKVQDILNILTIMPDKANFKNEEEVRESIINFVNKMANKQGGDKNANDRSKEDKDKE